MKTENILTFLQLLSYFNFTVCVLTIKNTDLYICSVLTIEPGFASAILDD